MGGGPDGGPMAPMGPNMTPVMNGDGMDMKNSPANGPGTPRDDAGSSMPEYNLGSFGPPENVRCYYSRHSILFVFKDNVRKECFYYIAIFGIF